MGDGLEGRQLLGVAEHAVGDPRAIHLAVVADHTVAPSRDDALARLPLLDDRVRDGVGGDERGAETGEHLGHRRLARRNATEQADHRRLAFAGAHGRGTAICGARAAAPASLSSRARTPPGAFDSL